MQHLKYFTNRLQHGAVAFAILGALAVAPQARATEMTHGEAAAVIRSANYPCAHVQALESVGDSAWSVQCNSGKFRVSRDQDGNFTVTQTGEDK